MTLTRLTLAGQVYRPRGGRATTRTYLLAGRGPQPGYGEVKYFVSNAPPSALGQMSMVLGVCLGTLARLSWLRPHLLVPRGAIPIFVLLLEGLVGCAHLFGELPLVAVPLLLTAPGFAWAGQVRWWIRRRWLSGLMQVACILLLLGMAAFLATPASGDGSAGAQTDKLYQDYYGY